MEMCVGFAAENRRRILDTILRWMDLEDAGEEAFDTVHNYIEILDGGRYMIRKGAVSAKKGERILIPLNMRDGCIVAVGRGNPDWNYSTPHGAGRKYSRKRAAELFSVAGFKAEMKGIYSTSVRKETLDESPMAYKDGSEILSLIDPSVEIKRILKPVHNFKDSSKKPFRH